MRARYGRLTRACSLLLVALAWAFLAGCRVSSLPTPTPMTAAARPTATPNSPAAPQSPGQVPAGATNLSVWLPSDIAGASVPVEQGATLLIDQIAQQASLGESLALTVTIKALHGPGGLRESLLATAPVAPARLPHLALVDSSDLPALAMAGLAQPLAGPEAVALLERLSPLAQAAVMVDGIRYGLPLGANLVVLAYDAERVGAPPASWTDLLTSESTWLFPAGAERADGGAADVLLANYLSEGGLIAARPPILDTAALSRALAAYQVGRTAGAIAEQSAATDGYEASWAAYLARQTDIAAATSLQLLRDQDSPGASARRTRLAPLPTSGGQPVVIGRMLVWVVVTREPEAQRVSLALAAASLDNELQRQLAARAFYLPVAPSAWDADVLQPWRVSLVELAGLARPLPANASYALVEDALAEAAASVVAGTANPSAAASLAAAHTTQAE